MGTVPGANDEAETIEFDPFAFDILPDRPGSGNIPPVTSALSPSPLPAITTLPRKIPASISSIGYNGNNMPDIAEGLAKHLEAKRTGRSSLFSLEIAADIIEAIEDGATMEEAAKKAGITRKTIWAWMQLSPAFGDEIARARELQAHAYADDAVKIIDNAPIVEGDAKTSMVNQRKADQQGRIRMELAKCFNFKQYGDKKQNMNLNLNADVSPVDLSKYGS